MSQLAFMKTIVRLHLESKLKCLGEHECVSMNNAGNARRNAWLLIPGRTFCAVQIKHDLPPFLFLLVCLPCVSSQSMASRCELTAAVTGLYSD
jgi:hypothetical protein